VARGGITVAPKYSIKITTSIKVKFSPVTDFWVSCLLGQSVEGRKAGREKFE
jgi:hypothetical protein